MTTVNQALAEARARLAALPDADADLDARVLLCHALEKPATWPFAWPDAELTAVDLARIHALVERRAKGTPVAYLTGQREFWGLQLSVSPSTLIPRPDTEQLVETALRLGGDQPALAVLDLGTGTGAIALALAHERPRWSVTATDASPAAAELAQRNADALGLSLRVLTGNWFEPLPRDERFHLVVSNPPYIRDDDPHLIQGDVAHEPRSALTAGPDGLDDLRRIVANAPAHLSPGGWLAVEHGFDQADAVRQLLVQAGYVDVDTDRDLAGHDRVSYGRWQQAGDCSASGVLPPGSHPEPTTGSPPF